MKKNSSKKPLRLDLRTLRPLDLETATGAARISINITCDSIDLACDDTGGGASVATPCTGTGGGH